MIIKAQTILCFDLGTKTGWAICGADGHIISGVMNQWCYEFPAPSF
ncbi:hypothetical protein O99_00452 [Bartonella rochalimae ATCC BAA-1498]|uniref:Uncharacterized protein n=1 Tax=Bartonella rochalimae ATCC BAA-1498 TaxID=685782 RepID=A0A067WAI9_9HYPH|nr:hypothetical protein O99_00452 [Bartonella rochalimae ATCC BAA-1498]